MMTHSAFETVQALSSEELDQVVGGIIIVGGVPQLQQHFASPLDRLALNPQPIPPRILFGTFGT
jgi:hypothetical protein